MKQGILSIPRLPQSLWLLWGALGFSCLLGVLAPVPGIQGAAKLLLDGLWLLLAVYLARFYRPALTHMGLFVLWIGIFFLVTAAVQLVQQGPWLSYLWALRNHFRFYTVFLGMAAFGRQQDGALLHRVLEGLFWMNIPVTLVQFFFLDVRGDLLGGIFGRVSGVNGSTNLFFLLVITHSILQFLDHRESAWRCLGKCAAALVLAAMAELKFFFVLFLLVVILGVLGTELSWRKAGMVLAGTLGAVAGAVLLTGLFPRFAGWFSAEWLWDTAVSALGYTGSGDLNRLNAISGINGLFFHRWPQRIFGMGLGSCETSAIGILQTSFFRTYGHLHYNWMSHSFWYLELGWAGLVFFFGFFVLTFFNGDRGLYGRQNRILSVCCLLVGVYNASLRTETANLMYAVLALPYVRRQPL